MGKRVFDMICSALGLAILLPIFALIALLIKLDSPGPVFFRQKRVGKNFTPFDLLKFRSMVDDAPQLGPTVTVSGDRRITRIGSILRKTKIDELPQLINVLKGDMSMVGPRPEVPRYVELFRTDYTEILKVKPGITDYASIKYRNEESVLASYPDPEIAYLKSILPQKISYAKQYIHDRNTWTDIKILVHTLLAIVKS
jgi:lipopolysaccharide/colanic/teichoic acid biosynthesis glycosyltransferase